MHRIPYRLNHFWSKSMNTIFLLMAEYNATSIPLEVVAEKFLGLKKERAYRLAATQSLPFPVFRSDSSQKSRWMVHITDLALFLDTQHQKAVEDWKKANENSWITKPLR